MLTIKLIRDNFIDTYVHWGVDEKLKLNSFDYVAEVLADGEELEFVKNKFCVNPKSHPHDKRYTIPVDVNATSFKWFGDFAKIIAGNL